ncbi:DNA polymerase III subunit delta' [Paracoccus fistulariae]|uniref:DNA polymerase III subunit delta n=1 Tax=Paracoccus fistulariae TaxID=658446 RepID=A0ABY7SJR4_9RHOB|nr:DNA polymerase III subunit delta' [Paracoccus fistulariae]MDB6180647.1 DNA polymerase III subunit delta' [Paracoccus fistulariae]WCR07119.1 DNA polymerase III subunit delta' [Paracoccus fistulariae]
MKTDPADIPEPDRVPGAPHPRHTARVIGQDHAIAEFTDAARGGRLHHAWMLTGPRGVGKATLAWAMARWMLADSQSDDLTSDPDAPTSRRIAALSEPRLQLIRRPWDDKAGRLSAQITVDEIRRLLSFFHMSSAEGGRRIAIIDAADDMNTAAANALLKVLEEPPKDALILIVTHQPARLLPTIRSRCRSLRLSPLNPDQMGRVLSDLGIADEAEPLAALSDGSVGEALRLAGQDGLARFQQLIDLFGTLPRMDRMAAAKFADGAAGRAGADGDPFDLTITLLDRFLTRAARAGLMGPPLPQAANGEGALLARLSPDDRAARIWADAQARLSARARAGRAVNLDPAALVMDMVTELAHLPPAQSAPPAKS